MMAIEGDVEDASETVIVLPALRAKRTVRF
jgi:hypothetical protein